MRSGVPLFVLSSSVIVSVLNAVEVSTGPQHYFWIGVATMALFWALVTARDESK
jgi:hypothetical protein